MAADTDGYFSADHQKIAIRQGMSEVQTVSATVHEIAHSKLHDPKKYEMLPSWKVVLESCLLYTSRCVEETAGGECGTGG